MGESPQVQQLRSELAALRKANENLKARIQDPSGRLQVVHRIYHSFEELPDMYLDQPRWLEGDEGMASLQGHLPVTDIVSYIDRHPEVISFVFRGTKVENNKSQIHNDSQSFPRSEYIYITPSRLAKNLEHFFEQIRTSLSHDVHLDLEGSKSILVAP